MNIFVPPLLQCLPGRLAVPSACLVFLLVKKKQRKQLCSGKTKVFGIQEDYWKWPGSLWKVCNSDADAISPLRAWNLKFESSLSALVDKLKHSQLKLFYRLQHNRSRLTVIPSSCQSHTLCVCVAALLPFKSLLLFPSPAQSARNPPKLHLGHYRLTHTHTNTQTDRRTHRDFSPDMIRVPPPVLLPLLLSAVSTDRWFAIKRSYLPVKMKIMKFC